MRFWLARQLLSLSLIVVTQSKMKELLMTVFEKLAAIETRLTALEAAGTVDTSTFATADSVTALSARVDTLDAEIGTPPVDATA